MHKRALPVAGRLPGTQPGELTAGQDGRRQAIHAGVSWHVHAQEPSRTMQPTLTALGAIIETELRIEVDGRLIHGSTGHAAGLAIP
jgi:hypothetical protein